VNKQPLDQAKQLAVHHQGLVPGVGEHPLEVQHLLTVGTGLFLTQSDPAPDTELMELVATAESEGVLLDSLLVHRNQELQTTNCTNILLQMYVGDPITFKISNVGSHFLSADLSEISGYNAIVESIEQAQLSQVHPDRGVGTKYQVQSEVSGHYGDEAEYSGEEADIVNKQKPFIDKSWCCSFDWLLQGTFGDQRCDERENQPDTGQTPVVHDVQTKRNDRHPNQGAEMVISGSPFLQKSVADFDDNDT